MLENMMRMLGVTETDMDAMSVLIDRIRETPDRVDRLEQLIELLLDHQNIDYSHIDLESEQIAFDDNVVDGNEDSTH